MKIVRRKLEKFKRPGTLTFAKVASIYAARWAVKLVEETRMTILVYCHATGKFYYHFQAGNQAAVNARSGPWGKGSAPAGSYTVERPVAIEPTVENSPYTDAQGFAWFARIVPRFQTERYGFGIHPDGNVPGTRGCIGIAVGDTKPVFDFLKQAAEPIVLVVVR